MTRRFVRCLVAAGLAVVLWSLRDPAWLGAYRHGVYADGWTGGRASVFLPTDQARVTFDVAGHDQFTMQVSIFVDGQLVDRFSLGEQWRPVTVTLDGRPSSRRHRRLDIHVARAWGDPRKGIRIRGL